LMFAQLIADAQSCCTKLLLQQSQGDLQLCHLQNLNGSIAMRLFKR